MSTFNGILEPFESTQRFILELPESYINKKLKKRQNHSLSSKLRLISPQNLLLLLDVIKDLTDSLDRLWVKISSKERSVLKSLCQKNEQNRKKPNLLQVSAIYISLAFASIVYSTNFFKLFKSRLISLLAAIEEQAAIDEASDDFINIKLLSGEEKIVKLGDFLESEDLQVNIQLSRSSSFNA